MGSATHELQGALESYDQALADHYEYGPNYTDTELKDIADRRAQLEARLALLKQTEQKEEPTDA